MRNVLYMCCCSVVSAYCTSLMRAIAAVRPDVYNLKDIVLLMVRTLKFVQLVEEVFIVVLFEPRWCSSYQTLWSSSG
jgi:hypothetical protein